MTLLQEAVQAWRKGLSSPVPKMYGHSVDGNGAVRQRHGCGAGVFMPTWAKVLGFHLLPFWGCQIRIFQLLLVPVPTPLEKEKDGSSSPLHLLHGNLNIWAQQTQRSQAFQTLQSVGLWGQAPASPSPTQ